MQKILPALACLFLFGCKSKFYFIGNTNEPTNAVTTFFDKSSIKKPYTIMGYLEVNRGMFVTNSEKIYNKIKYKAMKCGADGILYSTTSTINHGIFTTDNSVSTYDTITKQFTTTNSGTVIQNPVSTNTTILFIKYQ